MELILKNRLINAPIKTILEKINLETNGQYFNLIRGSSLGGVLCQCPFHKDGKEQHPSCSIVGEDSSNVEYGVYHCFTCHKKGRLFNLVNYCFDKPFNDEFGKDWLIDKFSSSYIEDMLYLPEITYDENSPNVLDNSELDKYEYENELALDYLMNKRKLSRDVINYFKLGYNRINQSITFPCWNEYGNLVGIFERKIFSKNFIIPKISPKPIYLLNEAIKQGYKRVMVCESQINALYAYSLGIPAIALFGTGSKAQYELLNVSGIDHFILCFDGDEAGRSGKLKFMRQVKHALFSVIDIPKGKDFNDLSPQEALNLYYMCF